MADTETSRRLIIYKISVTFDADADADADA